MIRVFAVLVLLVLSFAGGIFYQKSGYGIESELEIKISRLESESESLSVRNRKLKETLDLVKRQIQTDRIAYQTLRESFENFDQERSELKARLERQRVLLEQLEEKLPASE